MRFGHVTPLPFAGFMPVDSLDDVLERLDADGGQVPFSLTDPGPGPDQELEYREFLTAVVRFAAGLPAREREILRRVLIEEETQTAVAVDLGVSKMAISKAVARIRYKARVVLAQKELLALDYERGVAAARASAAEKTRLLHGGENRCRKCKEK